MFKKVKKKYTIEEGSCHMQKSQSQNFNISSIKNTIAKSTKSNSIQLHQRSASNEKKTTTLIQRLIKHCSCSDQIKNKLHTGYYCCSSKNFLKSSILLSKQDNIIALKQALDQSNKPLNVNTLEHGTGPNLANSKSTCQIVNEYEYDVFDKWDLNCSKEKNRKRNLSSLIGKSTSMDSYFFIKESKPSLILKDDRNQSKISNKSMFKIKKIVIRDDQMEFEESPFIVDLLNEQLEADSSGIQIIFVIHSYKN
jgi:hypothetical protein